MAEEQLYAAGKQILAACAALGLPYEVPKAELLSSGWVEHHAANGFYAHRPDPAVKSTAFLAESVVEAPAERVIALVREFDVSGLAGQLADFKVLADKEGELLVDYVSTLPWPFEPRHLHAQMLFGVDEATGRALVLGRSRQLTAEEHKRPGMTLGDIHYR